MRRKGSILNSNKKQEKARSNFNKKCQNPYKQQNIL